MVLVRPFICLHRERILTVGVRLGKNTPKSYSRLVRLGQVRPRGVLGGLSPPPERGFQGALPPGKSVFTSTFRFALHHTLQAGAMSYLTPKVEIRTRGLLSSILFIDCVASEAGAMAGVASGVGHAEPR